MKFEFKDREFELDEKTLTFVDGYAAFKRTLDRAECWSIGRRLANGLEIQGIVNKDLKLVLSPNTFYQNIEIFPDGNFMVLINEGTNKSEKTMICHCNKTEVVKKFNIPNYKRINKSSVVVSLDHNGFAIYNVLEAKYVSESFSRIIQFCKIKDIFLIQVAKEIDEDYELIYYIDLQGKIRSKVYSTLDDKIYDVEFNNSKFRHLVVDEQDIAIKLYEKKDLLMKQLENSVK